MKQHQQTLEHYQRHVFDSIRHYYLLHFLEETADEPTEWLFTHIQHVEEEKFDQNDFVKNKKTGRFFPMETRLLFVIFLEGG